MQKRLGREGPCVFRGPGGGVAGPAGNRAGGGWIKPCLIPVGVLWGKQEMGGSTAQFKGKQKGRPSETGICTPPPPPQRSHCVIFPHLTQYLTFSWLQGPPCPPQASSRHPMEVTRAGPPGCGESTCRPRAGGALDPDRSTCHLALRLKTADGHMGVGPPEPLTGDSGRTFLLRLPQ